MPAVQNMRKNKNKEWVEMVGQVFRQFGSGHFVVRVADPISRGPLRGRLGRF